jgi:hypothetical protein
MAVRHAFIMAGSLWEIARFFIVLSLLAQIYYAADNAGPGIIPWLLLGGSGNLLVAVGGIMLSLFPKKYGELIGFLRLGKVLCVFSFLLLFVSGALAASARLEMLRLGSVSLSQGALLFVIFLFDLLFLAALIVWRREKRSAFPAVTE